MKWGHKQLSRSNIAGIIEIYATNPDLSMYTISRKFGINPGHASEIISKYYFYKRPSETTEIIVKSSAMNDEIELKQTA